MSRSQWLRQFESAKELAELYVMQQIEPTGLARLEHYLARIITVLEVSISGESKDWRDNLIGYEPPEATSEQVLKALDGFEQRLNKWQQSKT